MTRIRWWGVMALASMLGVSTMAADTAYVRVSPRDARYFELSNGQPYIPVGLNLIAPDARVDDEAGGLKCFERWFQNISTNHGNYVRVWISSGFWDVEHERSGVYDEAKAKRIEAMLALARRYGIRTKLCIEHFRSLDPKYQQKWGQKLLHLPANGGPAANMEEFFTGDRSREQFKRKLAWLQKRFGNNPTIFGWELWNEVNAVAAKDSAYMPWTQTMLGELHRLFPRNLAMQSLGSFDRDSARDLYRRMSLLPGNDVAQVHRYLDQGAKLDICRGPMDVLAAAAVRELQAFDPHRPILLAESGAVEPSHSGPSKLYAKDKAGILLHDVLFAPFFAGAAGPGHCWHWNQYVDRNNLWFQIGRFAAVMKDLDPPAEAFQPMQLEHPRLRIYVLKGKHTVLVWCRDSENTWRTELEQQKAPETLKDVKLDLADILKDRKAAGVKIYDPWKDEWSTVALKGGELDLPPFSRSIVVRLSVRP